MSGQGQAALLQRRKLKQGRVGELKAENQRDSPRKPVRSVPAKPAQGAKETIKEKPPVKKENTGIDLDSWVQQQKAQSKTEQLHKKLAEFTPKPTEDRSADLKRVLRNSSDEDTPRDQGGDAQLQGGVSGEEPGGHVINGDVNTKHGKSSEDKTGASDKTTNQTSGGDRLKPGVAGQWGHTPRQGGRSSQQGGHWSQQGSHSSQPGGHSPTHNKSNHPGQPPGGQTPNHSCNDHPDQSKLTLALHKESSGSSGQGQGSRSSSGSHNSGGGCVSSRLRKTSDESVNARKSRESSTEKSGAGSSGGAEKDPEPKSSRKTNRTSPPEQERATVTAQTRVAVLDPGIPNTGGRRSQAQRLDGEIVKKPQPQPQGRQALPVGTIALRLPSK